MLEGLKQVADHSSRLTDEVKSIKADLAHERDQRSRTQEDLIRAQEQLKHLEHAVRNPIGTVV